MLADLKFVMGAVGKREIVQGMTHFSIEGGRVRSYNGELGLCSPIDFHIDCMPKAIPLVKAIGLCNESVKLTLTPSGRLSVHSGRFRALVECNNGPSPHVDPEGEFVDIDGAGLLKALATLDPFIGNDASREWTCGVLLRGDKAYATNNVMLLEYTLDNPFPHDINLPSKAVDELLRIGEACERIQVTENAVTFHFAGDRWLRTQLYSTQWPDFSGILNVDCNTCDVDETLYEGLAAIKPFANSYGQAFIWKGLLSTSPTRDEGAVYEINDTGLAGLYRIEMLEKLRGVATGVDFSKYPGPCLFVGENLRGAIIGMRM